MSTCLDCTYNPCQCCDHGKPPGTCVICLGNEKDELEQRVADLETTVEDLKKRMTKMEEHTHKTSPLTMGTTGPRFHEP